MQRAVPAGAAGALVRSIPMQNFSGATLRALVIVYNDYNHYAVVPQSQRDPSKYSIRLVQLSAKTIQLSFIPTSNLSLGSTKDAIDVEYRIQLSPFAILQRYVGQ
jgi:hypothetical protein